MLFFYLLLILVGAVVAEKFVIRKYHIEKRRPFKLYKPVNKAHQWIEISFLAIFIIGLFIVGLGFQIRIEAYYSIGFISALYAFRAYMERAYEKESKRYMISTLTSGFSFLAFIVFFIYLSPQQVDVSHEAFVYSEDDSTGELIDIEITGKVRPNMFGEESITGEITIDEGEYYLSDVIISDEGNRPDAPFTEDLEEHFASFFENDGNQIGEIWASGDFTHVAGRVYGTNLESSLVFVAPASSIDEGNELIRETEEK
ncbi:hypothetical protein CR194_09385 [Salipaludibacillus keqinensis]|uniref:DUF4181 domain-containing protein n=1 Tax=Salipaludibacillus keqinensis TaxID=2045207 RepID=A0A323TV62_9BACI|nr:DUF4181 domain-containing protein [Salipaludibacillus keqinensis]PYZ93385.1 hypothetical protein CR194_09385 [Salipaludibacillus keqinensis]